MKILVTGGYGYIGSNLTYELVRLGHEVRILDNLTSGNAQRLNGIRHEFIEGDVRDEKLCVEACREIEFVFHLAAKKSVHESISFPEDYFDNNVAGTITLMRSIASTQVQGVVFSSSAAVYQYNVQDKLLETSVIDSPSPYGHTKAMAENVISQISLRRGIKSVSLRYFNVVGSINPKLVDRSRFNLIPSTIRRIHDKLPAVIYGEDYRTVDGTCVRDYVHVGDLVRAHIQAMNYVLNQSGAMEVFNVGNGFGHTVKQVVEEVFRAMKKPTEIIYEHKRPGDPPYLVASIEKAKKILDWEPISTLEEMIKSSLWGIQ